MNKRLMLVLLCAISILFSTFAFTACQDRPNGNELEQNNGNGHKHTYSVDWSKDETFHWHAATCEHIDLSSEKAEHSFNEHRICSVCGYVNKLTFAEFVENYKDEAQALVSSYIEPNVIKDKTVLSREYYVNTNSSGALDTVNIIYTYKTSETGRAIEIANAKITPPISLDDVSDENVGNSDITILINTTTAFEFDAKDNYNRQELAKALYSAAGESSSSLKLFTETESSVRGYRFFNLLTQNNNVTDIITIAVRAEDSTDETLINNLSIRGKYERLETTTTYDIDGTNIFSQGYTLEVFKDGPGPELPGDDIITDAQVKEALDQNCADGIIEETLFGINVNKNNITNNDWFVTTNEAGNITQAEYRFTYNRSNTSAFLVIGSVEFNSAISKQDLIEGNLSKATYNSNYLLGYNPAIQEARSELTEAILKTCLGELTDGSTRIIVDNGGRVDNILKEARSFTVVEITNDKVKEFVVTIQSATNDNGYIANLNNEKYYINFEKSYEITGTKLIAE